MTTPWTLAVLPAGAENLITLGSGRQTTHADAFDAARDLLVDCAAALGAAGRQEYHLTVAGALTIVMPGTTEEGLVDLVAIHDMTHQHCTCRT